MQELHSQVFWQTTGARAKRFTRRAQIIQRTPLMLAET